MKKIYILLLILISGAQLFAEDVVLKYWTEADQPTYFTREGFLYTWQFQRYELDQPCKIKEMTITLFGEPSAVTIVLIGNEGRNALPQYFMYTGKDVLAFSQFQYAGSTQPATITLPLQTPIEYIGEQVFIGVKIDNPDKTFLLTATTELQPSCTSENTGNYGFQVLADDQAASINEMWRVAGYTYLSTLTVEYSGTKYGYLSDRTLSTGLLPSLTNETVAWGDYDQDNNLDLLATGKLYRYMPGTEFKDATTTAGITGTPQANAFIDIDNDMDLDILFLNGYPEKCKIFINDGFGNFTANELNMPAFMQISGISIADVNNDSYPDLFVAQSYNASNNPYANYLFINNKDNTFTVKNGACVTNPSRRSVACSFVDYDNDGDQDLFVTNYFQEPDELWENRGNLTFVNVATDKSIDIFQFDSKYYANSGTGTDWYDFDNDNDMDLLISQATYPQLIPRGYQGTTLYRTNNGSFLNTWNTTEYKSNLGIEYDDSHSGGAFGDIDNDGLIDLLISVQNECHYESLLKHNADHTFINVSFEWGLSRITADNDACWADYNNDGHLDLVSSDNGKLKLYKNTYTTNNSWVEIDLTDGNGNYFAIGARVKIYVSGKIYTQEVNAGRGKKMQKPTRLHFGLGTASAIEDVKVRWPGKTDWVSYPGVKINQINKIHNEHVSVDELDGLSSGDNLSIIGPNPSSTYLAAEFNIGKNNSDISIDLFDLKSNLVENILIGKYDKGNYKLNLTTEKYAPGSYFLRLSNNGVSQIKSFVIIR
ncbi:MAG: hypothetical protein A2X64_04620 [Ignavibacteria bacterium GWF2_33_9]|nr:MAG: hypothetical protein A2X64_04620 [Ignavibacteria bacterium GWF2_33_9]